MIYFLLIYNKTKCSSCNLKNKKNLFLYVLYLFSFRQNQVAQSQILFLGFCLCRGAAEGLCMHHPLQASKLLFFFLEKYFPAGVAKNKQVVVSGTFFSCGLFCVGYFFFRFLFLQKKNLTPSKTHNEKSRKK